MEVFPSTNRGYTRLAWALVTPDSSGINTPTLGTTALNRHEIQYSGKLLYDWN
jgi:hypothetical protein